VTDEIEIRSGGAIAVDTGSLYEVAGHLVRLGASLDAAADHVRRARARLALARAPTADVLRAATRAEALAESARELARGARDAAAVYELVEAGVRRELVAAGGDAAGAAALGRRIAELEAAHPGAADAAARARREADGGWDDELLRQTFEGAQPLGPMALGAVAAVVGASGAVRGLGLGRVPRDAVLAGTASEPAMRVSRRAPTAPPASLADLADRVPGGDDRVRVDRYAMPDGSRRFVVYVAGTNAFAGASPWDMPSNLRLYTGRDADSRVAAEAALRDAGARRGDVVYSVGHSQGGMIAGRVALEGGYDVRALVTFGSPVEADVGEGTTSVQFRHRDDPVAFLAGGGGPLPVGAGESFVVERTVDPGGSILDLALDSHGMAEYAASARLADASGDPRVARLRELLAELAPAHGEAVSYAPGASPAGGGGAG